MIINIDIEGVSCKAELTYYQAIPRASRSPWFYDSDWDFFGYEDVEFKVLDCNENPAPWLAEKLTKDMIEDISKQFTQEIKGDV